MSGTKALSGFVPLRSPRRWVGIGLTLQAIGAGSVAAYAWLKLRHRASAGTSPPQRSASPGTVISTRERAWPS